MTTVSPPWVPSRISSSSARWAMIARPRPSPGLVRLGRTPGPRPDTLSRSQASSAEPSPRTAAARPPPPSPPLPWGKMDPLEKPPTEPVDYAAISATYSALLGTLVLAARDRGEDLGPAEFIPLGIAAFALTKVVSREKIETWMRRPFVDEDATTGRRPKGRRLRYAVGELLTCTRCLGAWSALGLTALRVSRPRESKVVTTALATSAVNDFIFAAFAWLCAGSDTTERAAEPPQSPAAATSSGLRPARSG